MLKLFFKLKKKKSDNCGSDFKP